MTVNEFRSHKYLPFEWRKELRTNAILQRVLTVMEENGPDQWAIGKDNQGDISPTMAAIELGVTRGYTKFIQRLRLLAEPIQAGAVQQIGEPTYEKPPQENISHAR